MGDGPSEDGFKAWIARLGVLVGLDLSRGLTKHETMEVDQLWKRVGSWMDLPENRITKVLRPDQVAEFHRLVMESSLLEEKVVG